VDDGRHGPQGTQLSARDFGGPRSSGAAAQETFVFADLAGFTALTEAHGDEHAAEAASDFCDGVRALLSHYNAQELKTLGDAIMLRVPDPAGAVRLAVRILDEIGRSQGSLAVRIGVHTGPAVERDGDWFGATVNLAARVAAASAPGEVLMTEVTRAAAASALREFELQSRGAQAFKNVGEPVELHALVLAEQRNAAGLPVDPVCRMTVDPDQCNERRTYRGRPIYFCSPDCADVFDRHPERYSGVE
jgi:class 3 adenylate cyclase/YHS domain-containing protein